MSRAAKAIRLGDGEEAAQALACARSDGTRTRHPKSLGKIDNHDQEPWKLRLRSSRTSTSSVLTESAQSESLPTSRSHQRLSERRQNGSGRQSIGKRLPTRKTMSCSETIGATQLDANAVATYTIQALREIPQLVAQGRQAWHSVTKSIQGPNSSPSKHQDPKLLPGPPVHGPNFSHCQSSRC